MEPVNPLSGQAKGKQINQTKLGLHILTYGNLGDTL